MGRRQFNIDIVELAPRLQTLFDVQADAPSTTSSVEQLPANMSPEELDQLRRDLDFMMAHYEGELKKPIRNLVSGRLPRTLLIQVNPTL